MQFRKEKKENARKPGFLSCDTDTVDAELWGAAWSQGPSAAPELSLAEHITSLAHLPDFSPIKVYSGICTAYWSLTLWPAGGDSCETNQHTHCSLFTLAAACDSKKQGSDGHMLGFKMTSRMFTPDLWIVISPPTPGYTLAQHEKGPEASHCVCTGVFRLKSRAKK